MVAGLARREEWRPLPARWALIGESTLSGGVALCTCTTVLMDVSVFCSVNGLTENKYTWQ